MQYKVCILSSARGRFVLKIADTPHNGRRLLQMKPTFSLLCESMYHSSLNQLEMQWKVRDHQTHAFLFTCIEGEPLYVALKHTDMIGRHHLIAQFAQALRRVHSWEPDLPRPTDWLTDTLNWVSAKVLALPAQTLVADTNSRFDGINARQLLADIQTWKTGISNDIVFGHYDYCLPNVLVRENQVTGIIDWSGGGYIDRRFDLATALFTIPLADTLQDSSYLTTFLQAYGYTESIDTLYFFEALHALTCAFWQ